MLLFVLSNWHWTALKTQSPSRNPTSPAAKFPLHPTLEFPLSSPTPPPTTVHLAQENPQSPQPSSANA